MKYPPLEQAVIQRLPHGSRKLLVAVSGGVDSVVLLHLLQSLAGALNLSLQVAHLDHQLRPESSGDADFVKKLCAQWSIPCHIETCDVAALANESKLSLEMAGRQARREFLQRLAVQADADLIVLAHHRDDQVETFLLRLLRGSGLSGLAAMRVNQDAWWRPLLDCSRKEIMAYAQAHDLDWVEDASNRDPVFLRNRLRAQIVPQLQELNPQFGTRLAGLTRQIQIEENYWQEQVDCQFQALVIASDDGIRLDRTALLQVHPALRLRLLREALRRVRGDLQRIEAVHLQAVAGLLLNSRSQAQLDLPDAWVARRYETLWFRVAAPELPVAYDLSLDVPGAVELPDGRVLRLSLSTEQGGESASIAEFSVADLSAPLRVRSWQSGDRFVPQGMTGHKRLKCYFSDNKIELEERLRVPVLVSGETIIWLGGMRRSNQKVASLDGGTILRVELL